jgi:hypothetical protein
MAYGLDSTKMIHVLGLPDLTGPAVIQEMVRNLLDQSSFLCDPEWKTVHLLPLTGPH